MIWLKNPWDKEKQEFIYSFDGIKFTFSGFRSDVTIDELNEFAYITDGVEEGEASLFIRADLIPNSSDVRFSDFSSFNPKIKRISRIYIGENSYSPFLAGTIRQLLAH